MNNMGSSDSVVRMDMKMLISEDIKIAAISYPFAATQTLLTEYIKIRREENPVYMALQNSDNQLNDEMETWIIVTITLVVIAVVLGIIACCCCKGDVRFKCVCCCTCCQCRWCIQSRQTSDESENNETPVDRIDEV